MEENNITTVQLHKDEFDRKVNIHNKFGSDKMDICEEGEKSIIIATKVHNFDAAPADVYLKYWYA